MNGSALLYYDGYDANPTRDIALRIICISSSLRRDELSCRSGEVLGIQLGILEMRGTKGTEFRGEMKRR